MEGCFDDVGLATVVATPASQGDVTDLTFKSTIKHWFYANLDTYGLPEMDTTTKYEVLEDGSLKLTRSVLRKPWWLNNIIERTWNGSAWVSATVASTELIAKNYWHRSMTSYFEGWTPFNRSVLPT